jgi:hypothetical protein
VHGKSFSKENPKGIRRKVHGKDLAPRSLRKKGKRYLKDCKEEELRKAGVC